MKSKRYLVGIRVLLILFVLSLLAACGGPANCETAHNDDRTYRLQICTDRKKHDFGDPVPITFTVTNLSDESLVLDGGNKPALDIRARGEHWSDGQELVPELTRVTLEPGESRIIQWVWPTASTDVEEQKREIYSESMGRMDFPVTGIVIPLPGASRRTVSVDVVYRWP